MNRNTLAKTWATQSSNKGKASSLFFEGTKLYSYGYHFLVAEIVGHTAIFNPAKYSQTTSCHQSAARSAAQAAGLTIG